MLGSTKRLFKRDFDFVYLTPALLCNTAFLSGVVPAVFCLAETLFAYISVGIFLISIVVHIYILFHWKRYKDSSPLAYGIIQPALHLIMLTFALAVGATDICSPVDPKPGDYILENYDVLEHGGNISDVVADE